MFRTFAIIFILAIFTGTGIVGVIGGFWAATVPVALDNVNVIIPGNKVSANPAPDSIKGYTEAMGLRETLATFEYGLDAPYDRIYSDAPHFWQTLQPSYSYTPITVAGDTFNSIDATSDKNADNSNFWYVLPDSSGKKDGTCDVTYKLNAPLQTNYENFAPYNQLRLIWKGTNPDSSAVNIAVSVYNPVNKTWYDLGSYNGVSGKKYEVTFDLRNIPQEDRANISKIKFTTKDNSI